MKEPKFYRMVRPFISFLFKIVYRPTFEGLENIPKEGNVVLAGNHTHNFDCLLLIASTPRTIHFMAKDSLMKGMKKVIFKGMGIIPVDRSKKDHASLESAIHLLREEKVVGIFPEGTINKIGIFPEGTINRTDSVIMPFKIGAVKMAKETNAMMVPFVITGSYRILSASIHVRFLEPYQLTQELEIENEKLRKKVSNVLQKYKEEL